MGETTYNKSSAAQAIVTAWLIAGTMDLLGAITVYSWIMNRVPVTRLLQGIASGLLGKSAFDSDAYAWVGVGIHYLIALVFTLFYFLIFPVLPVLGRQRIVSGLIYGVFVWCVMNLAVLPLLHIADIPTKWPGIERGAAILMVCIGVPISLVIGGYYVKRRHQI